MSALCVSFCYLADNIFHVDVPHVFYITLVKRLETQGRRFTVSIIIIVIKMPLIAAHLNAGAILVTVKH